MLAKRAGWASFAVLLPAIVVNSSVFAQDARSGLRPVQGAPALYRVASNADEPTPIEAAPVLPPGIPGQPGYVQLDASMYPSPQPHTPVWTGGSFITNQAFAPHEMLYPHTYRAIYPPFYHKVHGKWIVTPFGVRSHERWELQGTMVQVKYRSHHPVMPSFHAPRSSWWGKPWY